LKNARKLRLLVKAKQISFNIYVKRYFCTIQAFVLPNTTFH